MGFHMVLGGNTEIVYKPGYYNNDVGNIWANMGDSESGQADSLNQDKESTAVKEAQEEKTAYRPVLQVGNCHMDRMR